MSRGDFMAISEARKRANDKYIKSQDEIKIRLPKGKKEVIQDIAASQGKSTNEYVKNAIQSKIKIDTGKDIEL